MENRLLLAFVLSLGVFIGWGYIMSLIEGPPAKQVSLNKESVKIPPSVNQEMAQQPGSEKKAMTLSEATQSTGPLPTKNESDFPGEETNIKVSTGLVTYFISTKGAMVKKILLSQHKMDSGELIDLVEQNNNGAFPLALESNNDQVTRILQNAYYRQLFQILLI